MGTISTTNGEMVAGLVAATNTHVKFTIQNTLSAGPITKSISDAVWDKTGLIAGQVTATDNLESINNYCLKNDQAQVKVFAKVELNDIQAAVDLYNGKTVKNGETEVTVAEATKTAMTTIRGIWGAAILDDSDASAPIIVMAKPAYAGVQETAIENGSYKIRLASTIDTAKYSKVGYKIQVNGAAEVTEYCKTVYTGLNGTVDGKLTKYSAEELGGEFVYALNIKDLDATQTYVFKVTPVAVEIDGITEHVGKTYTITYVKGVYSGCTVA